VVPPPPPQPTPQPKLLRRAEVIAQEPEHRAAETHSLTQSPKTTKSTIRGVVKWFDSRAGKGAVRLTGISGDLMLDAGLLSRSGIKRLYKDQEIEATVEDTGGRVNILSLALPGRATPSSSGRSGDGAGLRHQRRQVMIEVKQDNSRQKSARAEAEQLLANVGGTKTSRITSP
jgi:cold shock CspA family protein